MRRLIAFALIGTVVPLFLIAGPGGRPAPAGAATPTPTGTPTGTPTPPNSLPARFTGKITMSAGLKLPSKATLGVYTAGAVKCAEGAVSSAAYAANVPAKLDKTGCPAPGETVYFKLGDYWAEQQGTWQAGFPVQLDLTFPKMATTALSGACASVAVTFSTGTPIKAIADSIQPNDKLAAIWKWNGKEWDGYFPSAPAALSTLKTLSFLDVVWICDTAPVNLVQPSLFP